MRVLIDERIDWRLSPELGEHDVKTTRQMGWGTIKNGELLALASREFDAFLTVDRNLSFQQNVASFSIAVFVLRARTPSGLAAARSRPARTLGGGKGRYRHPHRWRA